MARTVMVIVTKVTIRKIGGDAATGSGIGTVSVTSVTDGVGIVTFKNVPVVAFSSSLRRSFSISQMRGLLSHILFVSLKILFKIFHLIFISSHFNLHVYVVLYICMHYTSIFITQNTN